LKWRVFAGFFFASFFLSIPLLMCLSSRDSLKN
jgi:hypothetical protein